MALAAFSGSRLAVGSSASTRAGPHATARATATRCCCPTLSCSTGALGRAIPSCESSAAAFFCCSPGDTPASIKAALMFSAAVNPWSRLKVWKIMPICRPRKRSRACPRRAWMSVPAISTLPCWGSTSPAIRDSRVLLPPPEVAVSSICSPDASSSRPTRSSKGWSGSVVE